MRIFVLFFHCILLTSHCYTISMDWDTRRRLFYLVGTLLFIVGVSIYGFRDTLFPTPTCRDGKQNGYETGVDCGGNCARQCTSETTPISVVWSRAILVSTSTYDLAALITNKNPNSAPNALEANFIVFDESGNEIYSEKIKTEPPLLGDMPVIIQGVKLDKTPKNVSVTLDEGTYYRLPNAFATSLISTVRTRFENGKPSRVYATIKNLTRNPFVRFKVRVVLYDVSGTAIGVGSTFVERLGIEEEEIIIFTWPEKFKEPPALIRVYPILEVSSL